MCRSRAWSQPCMCEHCAALGCPGCKGSTMSNVMLWERGQDGGLPVQVPLSCLCVMPSCATLMRAAHLPLAAFSCRPRVSRILTFFGLLTLKAGEKKGILPSCLANGVIGNQVCFGRAGSHPFTGTHPCVYTQMVLADYYVGRSCGR